MPACEQQNKTFVDGQKQDFENKLMRLGEMSSKIAYNLIYSGSLAPLKRCMTSLWLGLYNRKPLHSEICHEFKKQARPYPDFDARDSLAVCPAFL